MKYTNKLSFSSNTSKYMLGGLLTVGLLLILIVLIMMVWNAYKIAYNTDDDYIRMECLAEFNNSELIPVKVSILDKLNNDSSSNISIKSKYGSAQTTGFVDGFEMSDFIDIVNPTTSYIEDHFLRNLKITSIKDEYIKELGYSIYLFKGMADFEKYQPMDFKISCPKYGPSIQRETRTWSTVDIFKRKFL